MIGPDIERHENGAQVEASKLNFRTKSTLADRPMASNINHSENTMKKIAALCVAAAFAFSAVPAFAQCTSCGGSAPVFSQPVMSTYAPQATYSTPYVSQPVYNSAPIVSSPIMSAPMVSSPVMSVPMVSSPVMSSAPMMGTVIGSPVISSAPMMGGTIIGGGQIISSPAMGCGSCGGTVVGTPLMSGTVVGSPMMSGTVVGTPMMGEVMGSPMMGQPVYEGGAPIQGTVVSDVVIDSGTTTDVVEGTVETGSEAEIVEPPAAPEAEESPEPDAESTEGDT